MNINVHEKGSLTSYLRHSPVSSGDPTLMSSTCFPSTVNTEIRPELAMSATEK